MDIMDSSDTPEGGMNDRPIAAGNQGVRSEPELPLSVDEADSMRGPPQSSSSTSSSSSSPSASSSLDLNRPDGLPTSTDDITMHTQKHSGSTLESLKEKITEGFQSLESKLHSTTSNSSTNRSSPNSSNNTSSNSGTTGLSSPLTSSSSVADPDLSDSMAADSPVVGIDNGNNSGGAQRVTSSIHPLASSYRDPHLHPGLVSLPTHANERMAPTGDQHNPTDREIAQVNRAAQVSIEPKDQTASEQQGQGGKLSSTISALGDRLEKGVASVRDKVDDWAEQHIRSSPTNNDSTATTSTPPTMINKNDPHMNELAEARLSRGQN